MLEEIMNKLGYVSIKQAEEQVKAARTEALTYNPLALLNLFARDCRKFNFKVVSIEPDSDVATKNAEKLALHIADFADISVDANQAKEFSNRVIPLIKVVEDKSLLS